MEPTVCVAQYSSILGMQTVLGHPTGLKEPLQGQCLPWENQLGEYAHIETGKISPGCLGRKYKVSYPEGSLEGKAQIPDACLNFTTDYSSMRGSQPEEEERLISKIKDHGTISYDSVKGGRSWNYIYSVFVPFLTSKVSECTLLRSSPSISNSYPYSCTHLLTPYLPFLFLQSWEIAWAAPMLLRP